MLYKFTIYFHASIWVRCTPLCDKVCQWLATGRWFSPGPLVFSTNKTDCHDIAEILLKVPLNTIYTPSYLLDSCNLWKMGKKKIKKKKYKTKIMKLYNIISFFFNHTCMWNESNGNLLIKKNGMGLLGLWIIYIISIMPLSWRSVLLTEDNQQPDQVKDTHRCIGYTSPCTVSSQSWTTWWRLTLVTMRTRPRRPLKKNYHIG